jgi:hypothetical protein
MPPDMLEFQGLVIVCATVGFVACVWLAKRFIELRHERRIQNPDAELVDRLQRIEIAVETTALEVERISEANRFMAKLMAERLGPGAPPPKPERVITPH